MRIQEAKALWLSGLRINQAVLFQFTGRGEMAGEFIATLGAGPFEQDQGSIPSTFKEYGNGLMLTRDGFEARVHVAK